MSAKRSLLLVIFWLLCFAPVVNCQKKSEPQTKEGETFFPGKIKLLAGYKVQTRSGMEFISGKIWKDGGLTIDFTVGGIPSYENDPIQWQEQQSVNGHQVVCLFNQSGHLQVKFPYLLSSFHAKINDQRDLVEMLLMVLTFERPGVGEERNNPK